MRNHLLFSIALGLALPYYSFADNTDNRTNDKASYYLKADEQSTIQGIVSDDSGPLSGVTVNVVGTSNRVVTDAQGRYTISATQGSLLRFSSVGYKTTDVRVGSSSSINVTLAVDDNSLEEVVVVGYGQQKKAHLTGAVTTIGGEETFARRPIPDVGRGLQGTIPGLSVVVNGGEVGSDPIIKVRGQVGSVNGNSNPLILLDNVEITSISFVNPNDVESVTVLKDAASTSIYGAKAAFGVILITSKKGANIERNEFVYSNNFIVQNPSVKPDLGGIEGLEYTLDAHENMQSAGYAGGFWRVSRESLERIKAWQKKYGDVVKPTDEVLYNRDWYVENGQKFGVRLYDPVGQMIKENASSQIHNISMNGKRNTTTYNLSLGYLFQNGMMKPAKNDNYRRLTPTLSLSTQVNDWLTLRGRAMYTEGTKKYPNSLYVDGFAADPWLYLYRWSRLFPIGVQEDGIDIFDPVVSARSAPDAIDNKRYTNLNIGTTLNLTSRWTANVDYSYVVQNTSLFKASPYLKTRTMWDTNTDPMVDEYGDLLFVDEDGQIVEYGGVPGRQFQMREHVTMAQSYVSSSGNKNKRHTFNGFTTYNLNFENKHDLKFMLGANIVSYENSYTFAKRSELTLNDGSNPQFSYATGQQFSDGDFDWDAQAGFFGRVNYAFQDKYLLEANVRRDGSSKFPAHMRWRTFPSFSAGWVLTSENFMKGISNTLSFAKFRGSWGIIGDQSVSNNLYIPRMAITQNNWLTATSKFYQLGTPVPSSYSLMWQDVVQLNLGTDLKFFNNKLGITADWYERITDNMLVGGDQMPGTYGANPPIGNYGKLSTKGWEFAIDYTHRFENGLRLIMSANIADAKSITQRGADWNTPWENRSLATTFSSGRRYGDIYGYVTDRLYQKEDFMYDDDGNFVKTTIIRDGTARTMNVLVGDNPVYQHAFQDGGAVMVISPGDVKFVDVNGDGYIDAGTSTNGNPGDRVVIGNSTPRYQYGGRFALDYKGFDVSVFLQGIGRRELWGNGQLAIPGFSPKEGAMPTAFATDYWRPDRTDAFYPRAWDAGGSNNTYVMRAQSKYLLDMSYFRIKNITFGYALSENVLNRIHLSNARLYVSLENMFTFDNLRGLPIDPESITGVSMLLENSTNYNLGRTGTSNPTFKSASLGLQISF